MKGHLRQRGLGSWQIKIDIGRDAAGKRITEYHPFRGSRRGAQTRLAELITAVSKRAHVPRSALTVGEHVVERMDQWEKLGRVSPKTVERYRELAANQIKPHLGAIVLQELKASDIERWHATLKVSGRKDGAGGLSALTIRNAHRLLSKALKEAQRFDLIVRNPAIGERPPQVVREEVAILTRDEVRALVTRLNGRPIYAKAVLGLFAGLRRSEILALRWEHLDLEAKTLRVCEALEETKTGLRFKLPKSAAGTREVSLPEIAVSALKEQWKRRLEQCLALGMGKPSPDMLIFGKTRRKPSKPAGAHQGMAGGSGCDRHHRDLPRSPSHARVASGRCRNQCGEDQQEGRAREHLDHLERLLASVRRPRGQERGGDRRGGGGVASGVKKERPGRGEAQAPLRQSALPVGLRRSLAARS